MATRTETIRTLTGLHGINEAFAAQIADNAVETGTADARAGTETLVAGNVTVNTTAITATSLVLVSRMLTGGTLGHLSIGSIVAGTSFNIESSSGTDTSDVVWLIVEPSA